MNTLNQQKENKPMNRITYADYQFQMTEDGFIFDSDLDADSFMDLHDIEEDTLFSISSVNGVLHLFKVYEDDDDEPDEVPYENILEFKRLA